MRTLVQPYFSRSQYTVYRVKENSIYNLTDNAWSNYGAVKAVKILAASIRAKLKRLGWSEN